MSPIWWAVIALHVIGCAWRMFRLGAWLGVRDYVDDEGTLSSVCLVILALVIVSLIDAAWSRAGLLFLAAGVLHEFWAGRRDDIKRRHRARLRASRWYREERERVEQTWSRLG